MYPRTLSNAWGTTTTYAFGQARWNGTPCYRVEAEGPPEAYFGNAEYMAARGIEQATILHMQELPNGCWIARYTQPEIEVIEE